MALIGQGDTTMNSINNVIAILALVFSCCFSGCVSGPESYSSSELKGAQVKVLTEEDLYREANDNRNVVREGQLVCDRAAAIDFVNSYERRKRMLAQSQMVLNESNDPILKTLSQLPLVGATLRFPGFVNWTQIQKTIEENKGLAKQQLMQLFGYFETRMSSSRTHCAFEMAAIQVILEGDFQAETARFLELANTNGSCNNLPKAALPASHSKVKTKEKEVVKKK